MLMIILLVLFTLALGAWGLILFGGIAGSERSCSILAWLAVLILGVVVFLLGSGVIVIERPVIR